MRKAQVVLVGALSLCSVGAFAQGDRSVDAAPMPSAAPTPATTGAGSLSTPQLSPDLSNPGLNVNLAPGGGAITTTGGGASVSGAQARLQTGGSAAQSAGGAASLSPAAAAVENGASARASGGSVRAEQGSPSGARSPVAAASNGRASVSAPISGMTRSLGEAQKTDAKTGDGAAVASELRKIFDQDTVAAKLAKGAAGSAGAVSGRAQPALERAAQTAAVAETAAPQDAADLYRAAADAARDAGEKKLVSQDAARRAVETVMSFARRRAETALPDLAQAAYRAAAAGSSGAREAARALKGLDRWEALLGAPGKPVLDNAERLQADVARVQAEAQKPGARVEAPTVRLEKRGERWHAVLPGSSVVRLDPALPSSLALAGDPTAPLGASWLDDALLERAQGQGAGLGSMFAVARRGSRGGTVAAAASAAQLAARSWLASLWHWIKSLLARLLGSRPAAETLLARAPAAGETEAARGAAFVDLSSVNAPYLSAQRALSAPVVGARERDAALAAAAELAAASERLTGDGSGKAEVAELAARLKAEDPVTAADARLLDFWVERMREAALGAFTAPLLADTADGGMIRAVVEGKAEAQALGESGFELSKRGGSYVATFGPGKSSDELRAALKDAAAALSGHAPAGNAAPEAGRHGELTLAAAFVRAHPRQAELEAGRIQAELAATGARLSEVGRVSEGGRTLTVERAARPGRRQALYLLVQPETGRVFGYRAPAAP